jgi:hypothetical protein
VPAAACPDGQHGSLEQKAQVFGESALPKAHRIRPKPNNHDLQVPSSLGSAFVSCVAMDSISRLSISQSSYQRRAAV